MQTHVKPRVAKHEVSSAAYAQARTKAWDDLKQLLKEVTMSQDTKEELAQAARNMIEYGGSFASNIGNAYVVADSDNSARLVAAFPELFQKYHPRNWK